MSVVRQLLAAKTATPAAWMAAQAPEETDGSCGWMHAIAAQADYHTARWTSAAEGPRERSRDHATTTTTTEDKDEDGHVKEAFSRAVAAHRGSHAPIVVERDAFWRLGVWEGGLAVYGGLHPLFGAVTSRGPGPVAPFFEGEALLGRGGTTTSLVLSGLRRARNWFLDGNGPLDVFCEYCIWFVFYLKKQYKKIP